MQAMIRVASVAVEAPDLLQEIVIVRNGVEAAVRACRRADDAWEWADEAPSAMGADLPSFKDAMPAAHRLILISGELFHAEMATLSEALASRGVEHVFAPHPDRKHRWDSGWLEEGLRRLFTARAVLADDAMEGSEAAIP